MILDFYISLLKGISLNTEIHPTKLINLFLKIKANGGAMKVRYQLILPF
jgi:hypothetical protein